MVGEPYLRREEYDTTTRRDRSRKDDEDGLVSDPVSSPNNDDSEFPHSKTTNRGYSDISKTNHKATVSVGNAAGIYIPPAKRRQMLQEQHQKQQSHQENDNSALQHQTWHDQKRVIHGTINRLNESTIKPLIHDLFSKVNLLRLRGVLAKHVLQAALTSKSQYSNVYAALIAVLNTKLPEVGELVLKRAILAFRRHYRRREKSQCLAMAIFIGHLFHQAVVHELLILQILTLLLDADPTDDSVEVAVEFLTVVGQALLDVSPAGVRAVLDRLRALLHEGQLSKRVEYKIEVILKLRKTGFRDCPPPISKELDLVERDDQITFELSLDDDDLTKEDNLDVFRVDDDYQENEDMWAKMRAEILGLNADSGDDGDDQTDDDSDQDNDDEDENEEEDPPDQELVVVETNSKAITTIQDLSEADLVHLRRQIYLTIMSSATFEECTHKLTQINIPPGRECELINMIIECCSQERTFLRYYGLIGARFCLLDNRWLDAFLEAFATQYTTIHRLETNKLRNVAKLFAHLLHTDSMPWKCLSIVHLNEDETTSSSRIFVKILIQEMAEALGIARLKERFETTDPELSGWYMGMFPRDDVRKTRYAINFFTSIGLGPLTDGLREFLKNAPKMLLAQVAAAAAAKKKDDDESSESSSSSSTSSGSSSSLSSTTSYTSSSSYDSSSFSSSSSSYSSDSSSSSYSGRRRRISRRRSPSSSSSDSDSYDRRKVPHSKRNEESDKKDDRKMQPRDRRDLGERKDTKNGANLDSDDDAKRSPSPPRRGSPSTKSRRDMTTTTDDRTQRDSDIATKDDRHDQRTADRGRSDYDDRRSRDFNNDDGDRRIRSRGGEDKAIEGPSRRTSNLRREGSPRGRDIENQGRARSDRIENVERRDRPARREHDRQRYIEDRETRADGDGSRFVDTKVARDIPDNRRASRRRSPSDDNEDKDARSGRQPRSEQRTTRSKDDREEEDRKRRRSPSSSSSDSDSESYSDESRRNPPKRRRSYSSDSR
jgi:pre-mRNA-splicing factor CWC22